MSRLDAIEAIESSFSYLVQNFFHGHQHRATNSGISHFSHSGPHIPVLECILAHLVELVAGSIQFGLLLLQVP